MTQNTYTSRQSRLGILGVAVFSLLGIAVGLRVQDAELKRALIAGAATLLFGGLLGGFLKILLDDVVAARGKRADAAAFVANVLADLKAVYDRVGRSQILIPAHRSIKTYGEEMRDLIEARVQLRNVVRALEGRKDGVTEATRTAVIGEVAQMRNYLGLLTGEFQEHYKKLSGLQRSYEARAKSIAEEYGRRRDDLPPGPYPTFPWDHLQQLPVLHDFIADAEGGKYRKEFEAPTDRASERLRAELARILG